MSVKLPRHNCINNYMARINYFTVCSTIEIDSLKLFCEIMCLSSESSRNEYLPFLRVYGTGSALATSKNKTFIRAFIQGAHIMTLS